MQGVRKMLSVFLATVFLLTASFNSVMTHAESLDADKDFSSGRLIVMGNKEMLQDEPVIAELEGMVLIQ